MRQDQRPQAALNEGTDRLRLLGEGEVALKGRMPWSTNQTFLVAVAGDGQEMLAVYKPGRGERPLWDFPGGLYRREVAAWALSELLGWGIVPETVLRDGPLGEGSLQRFVDADFSQHYFTLFEDGANHDALRRICLFDLLANNTDRKGGHCLVGEGQLWGIDNGLCFHPEPKVRTVIWEFAGEAVPAPWLGDVERLVRALPGPLAGLLDSSELAGLRHRAEAVLDHPSFPEPDPVGHCYPWPLV
ncbi:MAG TPA: SCO1664 family protein [Acidimicrobiales bacterium]|nr:SCO1664 family protein [Acidimicrobiales bacterium]